MGIHLKVLWDHDISDHATVWDFIKECPERVAYIFKYSHDKISLPILGCDVCNNSYAFPYAIFVHCNDCNNGKMDICEHCSDEEISNHKSHNIDIDYAYNIINKYYLNVHLEGGIDASKFRNK